MYNRYLTAAAESEPIPHHIPEPDSTTYATDHPSPASGLMHGLSARLQNIHLDQDTLLVLAIVWFLLSGSEDTSDGSTDWEQLLLIGILVFLGI